MSSPLLVDILAYWNLNDDGSGNVSLVDSTGNGNTLTNNGGVTLDPNGIIDGCADFTLTNQALTSGITIDPNGSLSIFCWVKLSQYGGGAYNKSYVFWGDSTVGQELFIDNNGFLNTTIYDGGQFTAATSSDPLPLDTWCLVGATRDNISQTISVYINGSQSGASVSYSSNGYWNFGDFYLGNDNSLSTHIYGSIDEVGIWNRLLTAQEVTDLYNGGAGLTYPFAPTLYYNNAQNDGDWGNLLNWWQDSGFTIQATALPTATNPVNLYNQVTQNTQGADQCFCASANFWSANFGVGLTLQASGVVNMQGTSILAGTTTDGVSMHDSSQLAATSVIDGNVTMRDSSRAFGSIIGNATIYYDGGNGQYPIGGTVGGSVTYLGWPAVSPQWFNDQATSGGNNGDFSDLENWWSDDTYTSRPLNITGTQVLPDASTDVFIAPNTGITANSGTANPTVNSVTANNSNIQNISITATNGFLFSGNEGAENATLYGNVTFQDTAYNYNSVIQGTVTYKSAASLQNSWNQNSLGNLNSGASVGSTGFVVNISGGGGGGTALGTNWISRLLHLPWFINV